MSENLFLGVSVWILLAGIVFGCVRGCDNDHKLAMKKLEKDCPVCESVVCEKKKQ